MKTPDEYIEKPMDTPEVFVDDLEQNDDTNKRHLNLSFAKNIDEILQKKLEKIKEMTNAEIQTTYKMNRAICHYNSTSAICINVEPDNVEPGSNANQVIPRKYLQKSAQSQKMPTCGTWFEECCNCWFIPWQCIVKCCFKSSRCSKTIAFRINQMYFFILYLFTGELNTEALEYKNYFNVKSTKDDQVNVPEILVTAATIVFELYRTLIGSFLTVFTAQRCGQHTCTIWENIVPKNDLELTGIIFNFLMATTLLIEYVFEIMREAYLIKYLKYDKTIANTGEHIAELYEKSDKHIFTKLIPLYMIYIRFSYVVLFVYFVNVILSAVIVSANYYDNTSIFSFVTNALFIIFKIYNVVEITSYRGDYFYSAYKRKNIHYNTIKSKYLLQDVSEKENIDESPAVSVEPENIVVDISPEQDESNTETAKMSLQKENETDNTFSEEVVENQPPIGEQIPFDEFLTLFFKNKSSPVKRTMPVIDDGEDLNDHEKEEVLKELFEKKYIDKRVYFKIRLFSHQNKNEDDIV